MDIHKPKAAHSWREFLIEIGTIICGIVIALGLEQVVEYVHRAEQLQETREALQREHKYNVGSFAILTDVGYAKVEELRRDIALFSYLRDHPNASDADWPVRYIPLNVRSVILSDLAWRTAERSNIIQYMPISEAERYRREYTLVSLINDRQADQLSKVYESRKPIIEAAAAKRFSPSQIQEELSDLSDLMLLYLNISQRQRNLSTFFSDYKSIPDDRMTSAKILGSNWLDGHVDNEYNARNAEFMKSIKSRQDQLDRNFGITPHR